MTTNISHLTDLSTTIAALATDIPPVVNRDGKQYPFIGEKGVRKALAANPDLLVTNAVLMYHLQTTGEQAIKSTTDKNRRGLMSSHAKTASKVIESLLNGVEPADVEFKADGFTFGSCDEYLRHIGGRYAKQLSVALRAWAMAQEPELAITAGMFSVR